MGDAAKTAMHIKVTTIQSVFELPIAMASTPMAMASNLIAMAFNLVAASNPSKREMERERERDKERKKEMEEHKRLHGHAPYRVRFGFGGCDFKNAGRPASGKYIISIHFRRCKHSEVPKV